MSSYEWVVYLAIVGIIGMSLLQVFCLISMGDLIAMTFGFRCKTGCGRLLLVMDGEKGKMLSFSRHCFWIYTYYVHSFFLCVYIVLWRNYILKWMLFAVLIEITPTRIAWDWHAHEWLNLWDHLEPSRDQNSFKTENTLTTQQWWMRVAMRAHQAQNFRPCYAILKVDSISESTRISENYLWNFLSKFISCHCHSLTFFNITLILI